MKFVSIVVVGWSPKGALGIGNTSDVETVGRGSRFHEMMS